MKVTDFTTLTFDCYGSLIDWETGILAELGPWASQHGLRVSDEALLEAFGVVEAECERETPAVLYPGILARVLERLASRWGTTLRPGEADAFGSSVGRWPAFPDSPEALAYLAQHYELVILSNVDHASFARSRERLGVQFDRVITAQDIGSYKPDPRNFQFAIDDLRRTFGTEPREILHTAQSIFHDIVPAKRAGLQTMWINRRRGREGWGATPAPGETGAAATPDFEVESLAELAALHRQAHAAVS
jgi:2-haloalkanoic acid dehalogenase type II